MSKPAEYRYTVDYLNDQLCQYLHRTVGEMVEHMEQGVGDEPRLGDRLRGYREAIEDVQRLLEPGHRVADHGMKRIIHAARQQERTALHDSPNPPTNG